MRKLICIMLVGFLSIAFLVTDIYAFGGGCFDKGKAGYEKKWDKMTKDLNLTADQTAKLKANREAQMEKMKATYTALKEKKTALREAFKNPATTRESIAPIVAEVKALQSQAIDNKVDGIFAVKGIMTPGQYAKFNEKMEKKAPHKGHKGGYGKGNPDRHCQ